MDAIVEFTVSGSDLMRISVLGVAFGCILLLISGVLFLDSLSRKAKKSMRVYSITGLISLGSMIGPQIYIHYAKQTPYALITEGVYDHVEYTGGGFGSPATTVIYFSDGRTYVLLGKHNLNSPKGSRLKVTENEFYARVEEVR